ncbi:MAG TPA: glyceraldehyde 3-phosphate dehydrogenase NAD-binding domain-containing protein [Candidatus Polarisedimenticolia bacterium]|nr:glyceraldehyde 3-phosphate dehydrogenase NAD-binding domain-containing protein [Candidatus Polarisedimenticolia bacterium]
MPVSIGLMGFGRIGRNLFRLLYRRDDIRLGAISDIADPEALTYLLRYDTILGRFPDLVTYKNGHLYTWGREIPLLAAKDPGEVPWGDLGVDYVVEAVGRDRSRAEIERHLEAGARRVILCVPPRQRPDISLVYGVNHQRLRPEHRIVSNASCTAHCAAPVLATLHEAVGLERVHLTAVHAYTSTQRLADVPADDLRLSRAAAENIVPSETNAAAVLEEVLPQLAGRIHASALRVPLPNGSMVDMTLWTRRPVTRDGLNEVMRTAAAGPYRGILEFIEDPIVSSDIEASPQSSVFDALATMVLGGNLVKVIAWFNNGWGYSHRVVEIVERFREMDAQRAETRP